MENDTNFQQNSKRMLNYNILDYMRARNHQISAAEFLVESEGQIQETPTLLETWWHSYYDWYLPNEETFQEECAKYVKAEYYGGDRGVKVNPIKTARLNAYILSYLEHENFTKSCAAFDEEAPIEENFSWKDEDLFSKFWLPLEVLRYQAKLAGSSTLQVAIPSLEDLSLKETTLYESKTTLRIATCHFSADGKLLAFGGTDRMTGPSHIFQGHTSPVMSLDFCPSKPQILCSSDNQGEVCIWNVVSGHLLSKLKEGEDIVSKAVRFVTNKMVAAALGSRVMIVWILDEECKKLKVYQYLEGHKGAIKSICWDGARHLASVSEDSVRVWSMTNGGWRAQYSLDSGGHKFGACEFHPSHRNLLLIGSPQYMHVWDFTHGDKTRVFLACTGSVSALTASHETGLIAYSSRDFSKSQVDLWKLA